MYTQEMICVYTERERVREKDNFNRTHWTIEVVGAFPEYARNSDNITQIQRFSKVFFKQFYYTKFRLFFVCQFVEHNKIQSRMILSEKPQHVTHCTVS